MSDSYKVGVKLVMTSNAPQVLSLLSKELLGVNAKVRDLTGGFQQVEARHRRGDERVCWRENPFKSRADRGQG